MIWLFIKLALLAFAVVFAVTAAVALAYAPFAALGEARYKQEQEQARREREYAASCRRALDIEAAARCDAATDNFLKVMERYHASY